MKMRCNGAFNIPETYLPPMVPLHKPCNIKITQLCGILQFLWEAICFKAGQVWLRHLRRIQSQRHYKNVLKKRSASFLKKIHISKIIRPNQILPECKVTKHYENDTQISDGLIHGFDLGLTSF